MVCGSFALDSIYIDRRRVRPVRESEWKRLLNPAQVETLRMLEQIGWSIKFVRTDADATFVAVLNPDSKRLAIIMADGSLDENPSAKFRD